MAIKTHKNVIFQKLQKQNCASKPAHMFITSARASYSVLSARA